MLVVTRKEGESLRIGDSIVVTVVRVANGGIRVGIEAPREASIRRSELAEPPMTPSPRNSRTIAVDSHPAADSTQPSTSAKRSKRNQ